MYISVVAGGSRGASLEAHSGEGGSAAAERHPALADAARAAVGEGAVQARQQVAHLVKGVRAAGLALRV